jgi:uncharacterized membrane protein YbhN (UPF0104 family)
VENTDLENKVMELKSYKKLIGILSACLFFVPMIVLGFLWVQSVNADTDANWIWIVILFVALALSVTLGFLISMVVYYGIGEPIGRKIYRNKWTQ